MKSMTILELMIQDHGKIIKQLTELEKTIGKDIITTMRVFDAFEWTLEKHLFTEEKAIFTSYSPKNITAGYAMVPELIKEHNEILNKARLFRKDILKQKNLDVTSLKEMLMKHKTFEEEQLYPQLDKELDTAQKKIIINRIQEIV
jgi:hypothetical protein